MKWSTKIARTLASMRWTIGFVRGGMETVMKNSSPIGDCRLRNEDLQVDWVKMPKDRWFADPFILDVTEQEILLLVEDVPYDVEDYKGRISLLHIDRCTLEITSRKVLLEKTTHLSFPAIWRKGAHIYVYPESGHSGRLDMYEYHPEKEELSFVQTICDDVVWDSYITEAFGEPLMFTAAHDDTILDVYRWDENRSRFVPYLQIPSETPNSRMGGAVFEYKGEIYYPAQSCIKSYGEAIDIKRIKREKLKDNREEWKLECVKHITSPNPHYPLGLHTLNEYKGVVVIDARGYCYGWITALILKLMKIIKK